MTPKVGISLRLRALRSSALQMRNFFRIEWPSARKNDFIGVHIAPGEGSLQV